MICLIEADAGRATPTTGDSITFDDAPLAAEREGERERERERERESFIRMMINGFYS